MPDTLRAAIRTFFQALIGVGVVVVTGLGKWLADKADVYVPNFSAEAKVVITAAVAVVIGGVTFAVNWVQNKLGLGKTPEYTPAGEPPKVG